VVPIRSGTRRSRERAAIDSAQITAISPNRAWQMWNFIRRDDFARRIRLRVHDCLTKLDSVPQAIWTKVVVAANIFGWFMCLPLFGQTQPNHTPLRDAALGTLRPAQIKMPNGAMKTMPFFSAAIVDAAKHALDTPSSQDIRNEESDASAGAALNIGDIQTGKGTIGCSERDSSPRLGNTRVNQDCTFRRQAEEKIVYNPSRPDNLLAGQNDSRVGFNQCGISFSTDNGAHWGDMLPPFRQKINDPKGQAPSTVNPNNNTILGGAGTGHTYDAASDPAPAFDSMGRGFFSCVAFDNFSNASMVFVAESPLNAQGSFFYNIPTDSHEFIVVEDNSPEVTHDKEFIAADTFAGSPNRDNIYATWTVFRFSTSCGPQPAKIEQFCSSPIFGSMSTDHGHTWSTPEEISGSSGSLCFFGNFFDPNRSGNACDFDQGSEPTALSNGKLAVVFNNGNTAATNPNAQQLSVLCSPAGSSAAGTAHLNCAAPVKVGDDVVADEPLCDFGRGPEECVPGPFIRTNDFPRIAVSKSNGNLYSVWQDYRNGEYDIQMARSRDGGATWSNSTTINPDSGLDHYFAAVDLAPIFGPDRVGVSYYRSERIPGENRTPVGGFAPGQPGVQAALSDYVLAGGTGLDAPYPFTVLSPVFAPPDGVQAGFNGDYSGLTINRDNQAHPIWSDTRNADPYTPNNGVVHDEDVFTTTIALPSGRANKGLGQLGSN
jgi:hypothetical protein